METLTSLVRSNLTVVWAVLVAATLISFWMGGSHGLPSTYASMIVIMVVTMIKIRLVGMYFMELHNAPKILRSIFDGYCVVTFGVLVGFYALA